MSQRPILHHYPASPFSEKVRLCFGLKGLEWGSVHISNVMPRPELMPLTGGYRRTPVLQIGADIYCDSQVIVHELERRYPQPTLFPGASAGAAWLLSRWSDQPFFQSSVGTIFGNLPEGALPEEFIRDREELSGRPFDLAAMKASAPFMLAQWHGHAAWVEKQLAAQAARGEDWFLGPEPSFADITVHMNFWFVRNMHPEGARLLAGYPHVEAWLARVDALGHGQEVELSREEALELGRQAEPAQPTEPELQEGDPLTELLGKRVSVMPDDYGRVGVIGELLSASSQHVSVGRTDEQAGDVVVHFPRVGFTLSPI